MKKIKAENVDYGYLLSRDEIPIEFEGDVVEDYFLDRRELITALRSGPDTRIVLTRLSKGFWVVDILFWDDSTDLLQLDAGVLAGTYSDAQFVNSIHVYPVNTICFNCNHIWESLAISRGDYVGAPGLLLKKKTQRHLLRCPICGNSFSIAVVKIIGEHKAA
ncbi:hypothetical protein G8759_26615 [Spirosoma aureum]|uniref:Uncharacterized protein n=1 Tax=Spirosoma aureum TaxID=2692134 RepID=A0A6G9AU05_9BACT|nr:hypothetical protein [Spirosoma aureum]QIP15951.1 hypothetical protein G8759_26615 [Spirosoma aureum]